MNEPVRILLDPETGERYRVRIAPRELTGGLGVNPAVYSVVFETEAGQWVGAYPVFSLFRLPAAAEWELKVMLERVRRRRA